MIMGDGSSRETLSSPALSIATLSDGDRRSAPHPITSSNVCYVVAVGDDPVDHEDASMGDRWDAGRAFSSPVLSAATLSDGERKGIYHM